MTLVEPESLLYGVTEAVKPSLNVNKVIAQSAQRCIMCVSNYTGEMHGKNLYYHGKQIVRA